MPNWCSNTLTTKGDAIKFWERIEQIVPPGGKAEDFFGNFVPQPKELGGIFVGGGQYRKRWREGPNHERIPVPAEELERFQQEYGAKDWYEWSSANWGTKWDVTVVRDPARDRLSFDSAWSPPREFVERLSLLFPGVRFVLAYAEGGMGFFGVEEIIDGEVYERQYDQGGLYKNDVHWEQNVDLDDALTPMAAKHLEKYGLGTGG
jgi:Ferredoxin-like domain in Api92-like protein